MMAYKSNLQFSWGQLKEHRGCVTCRHKGSRFVGGEYDVGLAGLWRLK